MPNATAPSAASRPSIVIIHGFWCTDLHTKRLDTELREHGWDCHRLRLPMRTHGQPDAHPEIARASVNDYAESVITQIEALNLAAPPVVLGHSLGGLLAQIVATRLDVAALVLLTPAPPANVLSLTWRGVKALYPQLLRWGFWRKSHCMGAQHAARYAANGLPQAQQAAIHDTLVQDSGRVLFEIACAPLDLLGPNRHATRISPQNVRCPVWILAAEDDYLTPESVVRKVAKLYPQATLTVSEDRGHWVIDDDRTSVDIAAINDWLHHVLEPATAR